ncbi:tubulin polyglutamylase TTLL5 [Bacillus rossius redtenbacheri]|uniref:tubulin polyglutamylase TTLL5 n=1 Tax=Bacillus rossius redtenbacheri TaxID=93214 RepID=UPI002FDDB184
MEGTLAADVIDDESGKPDDDVCQIVECSESLKDIKLKDLPPVHQYIKKIDSGSCQPSTSKEDSLASWVVGGSLGSKSTYLQFRCLALSAPPACPPAHELHMTYKTIQAETKLLAAVLCAHGMTEVRPNIPDFNLLWTGTHPKPHLLKSMMSYQRVNHFPRSFELTRKDRLYKNIQKMQLTKGAKHFDFIPQTFVMPMDFREFCTNHYRMRGPWIVKPVASSRGRGIYIVNSPDQVPVEENIVVAKYIDNPLLVDGRKCDLRLYVAVTSYDPLLVYMYEEGLVRFAAVKYDTTGKHLWNPCMHLCNYSINKYHSDYVKSEDPDAEDVGHKWTLSALLRHLRAQGRDTALLMQQIEEVVVKAILASAPPIVSACRMFVPHPRNCFELYGFDILIDSALKPWLLEVNLSPSLGCDSPLDIRIKSAMLVDLLTLIGLPAVDPMIRRATESSRGRSSISCRNIQSADPGASSRKSASLPRASLSPEESRVVKAALAEYERRGGFVRIFPSLESWKRYATYLDPQTGITCTLLPGGGGHTCYLPATSPRNYNLLVHRQLFPELQACGRSPAERLTRYERALLRGHKAGLYDHLGSGDLDVDEDENESTDFKQKILDCIQNGGRLSQYQARRMFAQYLGCILRRVARCSKGDTDDVNGELIIKFLQKASTNLRTPYFVQIPSRKLAGKDRVAVVAKQLNDFIYLYNRETELYSESGDKPNLVSSKLFQAFLNNAGEADLEDVLSVQTQQYKCAHLYLGRCGPSAGGTQPLGLLRTVPVGPGECPALRRPPRPATSAADVPSVPGKRQTSVKISQAL